MMNAKASMLEEKIANIIFNKLCELGEDAKKLDWFMSTRFAESRYNKAAA